MKKNITFLMRVLTSAVFLTMLLLCTGQVSATTVSYNFTDLNSALIYTEEISFVSETVGFEIINSTGYTWTDFHVALDGSYLDSGYDFMRFIDLGSDGTIYYGSGTASFSDVNSDSEGYNEVMTIDGITIAHGATFSFSADIVGGIFPEGLGTYMIYAQPSIQGNNPPPAVPEPSTMMLLGLGLLGITGASRRKK